MCFDDDEPVPAKRVSPCGHDERFTNWEDHSKPILCLRCEVDRCHDAICHLTGKLAAAESEVSAMSVVMRETNLAMLDLQQRLAAAEAENKRMCAFVTKVRITVEDWHPITPRLELRAALFDLDKLDGADLAKEVGSE
jgi:hypothetical protein